MLHRMSKMHPPTSCAAAKHSTYIKLRVSLTRENQCFFFVAMHQPGYDVGRHNNFAFLSSFAKVSVFVKSIIPWVISIKVMMS